MSTDQTSSLRSATPISALLSPSLAAVNTAVQCLCLLIIGVTVLWLLWVPIQRMTSPAEVNYNEGWNAYKQTYAAGGIKLYGDKPDVYTGATSYPPISFHVIGLLAPLGSILIIGRLIALTSLLLTGILVGLIVRQGGATVLISVFSCFIYIAGIALLLPNRIAMNDPQLLGEALTTAGLYFYGRSRTQMRLLWLSAFLFCLGGFTKQNLLAFPVAVGIDLLFTSRRRFAAWLTAMLITTISLVACIVLIDGSYLLSHLTFPRSYSIMHGWHNNTHLYLQLFQALIFLASVWFLSLKPQSLPIASALLFSHLLAFLLAGGNGVDLNIYFNAFAALVIACGYALNSLSRHTHSVSLAYVRLTPLTAAMIALLGCTLIAAPGRFHDSVIQRVSLPTTNADFHTAQVVLASRPGPALCESLLLCFMSGKSYEFDPLVLRDQIRLGKLQEDNVIELLKTHYIQTIQLTVSPEEARAEIAQLGSAERLHFTKGIMAAIAKNYIIVNRTSQMLLLAPTPNAP